MSMDVIFRLQIFAIAMAIFWVLIYLINHFYDLESRGVSLNPGFLMWRTDTGVGFLDRVSKKFKKFWDGYGVLCSALGIIIMLVFFFYFAYGTIEGMIRLLTPAEDIPVPSGAKERPVPLPGVNIPFLVGIISLGSALLIHEPAHGILFRRLKLKIKSVGLAIFLFVIPGAFVEEDEEEFENTTPWKKVRIASSGPVSNVFLAGACLVLVVIMVNPLPGVYTGQIKPNSAADNAGLEPGAHLSSMDGVNIDNYGVFFDLMDETRPGDTINLKTDENQYDGITLGEHPSKNIGYLGIGVSIAEVGGESGLNYYNPMVALSISFREIIGQPMIDQYAYESPFPWGLIRVLKWIFALNLLIGVFNLLPLKPLDGGHIVEGISEKATSKSTANIFAKAISVVTLVFILLNFLIVYA